MPITPGYSKYPGKCPVGRRSEGQLTISSLHRHSLHCRLVFWYDAPPESKREASVRGTDGTTASQSVGRRQSQEKGGLAMMPHDEKQNENE